MSGDLIMVIKFGISSLKPITFSSPLPSEVKIKIEGKRPIAVPKK